MVRNNRWNGNEIKKWKAGREAGRLEAKIHNSIDFEKKIIYISGNVENGFQPSSFFNWI
jgi:hypothetical protein